MGLALTVGFVSVALLGAMLGGVVLLIRRRYVEVLVTGSSMAPAFQPGDRVLVRRVPESAIRPGAVVVVERPNEDGSWTTPPPSRRIGGGPPSDREWLLKRVIAVPGDSVPRDRVWALADTPEEVVPPGMLVLLGDAGRGSFDSKQVGYFPARRVLGVAIRSTGPALAGSASEASASGA